jgi:integrase
MPTLPKGIKINRDRTKNLWRIWCSQHGDRWAHASDRDKGKMIAVAKDLAARLSREEDIRPPRLREAKAADVRVGTVADIGAQWLVAQAKNNANNSTEHYDWALRSHIYPLLGHLPIGALTRDVCIQFAQDLIGRPARHRFITVDGKKVPKPIAFASRKQACIVLGILCGWARDKGYLSHNPADHLRKHTVDKHELPKKMIVWNHAQVAALLRVAKAWAEPWYLPLKFALLTGVRTGELLEVRWDDRAMPPAGAAAGRVAIERQWLTRPIKKWTLGADGQRVREIVQVSRVTPLKGRQARAVDVWPELWAELAAHEKAERVKLLKLGRGQSELMFTSQHGQRLSAQTFKRKVLPGLCRRADIPVTSSLHVTRHTFATVLLTAGEPLRYVSAQMGHRDESQTEHIYKHWIEDTRFDERRGQRVAAAWGTK